MDGVLELRPNPTDIDLSNFNFARVIYYDNFMDEGKTCNGKTWEALFL